MNLNCRRTAIVPSVERSAFFGSIFPTVNTEQLASRSRGLWRLVAGLTFPVKVHPNTRKYNWAGRYRYANYTASSVMHRISFCRYSGICTAYSNRLRTDSLSTSRVKISGLGVRSRQAFPGRGPPGSEGRRRRRDGGICVGIPENGSGRGKPDSGVKTGPSCCP